MADEYVITPGGYRLKSLVYQIEPGHVLDGTGNRLRQLDPAGRMIADFGALPLKAGKGPLMPANVTAVNPASQIEIPGSSGGAAVGRVKVPGLASGWITYAYWNNATGRPITSFKTTWQVPPGPASQDNQLIYLFNGIQNASMIYQPVLQWGNNGAFGGNSWGVACWYADGQGGPAFHSPFIPVSVGQSLIGIMTQTGTSGGNFNYNCVFQGIANAVLPIQNVQELTWCAETLECYNMSVCADYPATVKTQMTGIEIVTTAGHPTLAWTPDNAATDCGQHTVVVSNSSPNGEVDLYYQIGAHPWFLVHNEVKMQVGAAVTALWRSNDTHLDLFATGNDGAVWSTWWESAHGWQPWFLVHNEVKMQPGATVTALWRSNDTHLDLFATGTDGAVWSTWWESAHGWQPWFLVHNEVKMQRGVTVTALWRSNDTHLDLFATGNDGAVWSTWWESARGWQPWFLVHNEVKMQVGAAVTALWRSNDTHLDLFATGNDGAVWSTWWESARGWQPWFLVHNEVKMQRGVTVTALWRSNDTHLDLFATGNDGAVWSTWWESARGWQPWFLVHNEVKMKVGAPVTALWRSNDTHLDLFATGTDGTVWSTWWESARGWQPWFSIENSTKMQPGVEVSALWRSNDTHLDLFATGTDGAVWSVWWEASSGW